MVSKLIQVMRWGFLGLVSLTCLLSVLTLCPLSASVSDFISQFLILFIWVQLLGLVCFLLQKKFKFALLIFCFLVINVARVFPNGSAKPCDKANAQGVVVRLLQFNVWGGNRKPALIAKLIATTDPDVITFQEMTQANYLVIQHYPNLKQYSNVIHNAKDRIVMLSRLPLMDGSVVSVSPPLIKTQLKVKTRNVTLIETQMTRPVGFHQLYVKQIDHLIRVINESPKPVILMGDLNTGPWSYSFQRLLHSTGLQNTQLTGGIMPTYPANIPKTSIQWLFPVLPIDHVLVSPNIRVLCRRNGPYSGSDHLPVLTEVAIP